MASVIRLNPGGNPSQARTEDVIRLNPPTDPEETVPDRPRSGGGGSPTGRDDVIQLNDPVTATGVVTNTDRIIDLINRWRGGTLTRNQMSHLLTRFLDNEGIARIIEDPLRELGNFAIGINLVGGALAASLVAGGLGAGAAAGVGTAEFATITNTAGLGLGTATFPTGAGLITQNAATSALVTGAVVKTFSAKAIAVMAALGASASLIFWGLWGKAEAPEPTSIAMNKAFEQAQQTGNWDTYWEGAAARDEFLNMSKWQQLLMYIPGVGTFIGITDKFKGAIAGAAVLDQVAKDEQIRQETGESEDDKWERINQERIDRDEARRQADEEYWDNVRRANANAAEDARRLRAEERNDVDAYWDRVNKANEDAAKRADAARAADRKEEAAYWDEVRKQRQIDAEWQAQIKEDERKKYEEERERVRQENDAYWRRIFAESEERKRQERLAEDAYWEAVRRETEQKRIDNSPSQLNFGLL